MAGLDSRHGPAANRGSGFGHARLARTGASADPSLSRVVGVGDGPDARGAGRRSYPS